MKAPQIIKKHYENCFIKYGDNHIGADWPKQDELYLRYDVMLAVINKNDKNSKILDFGCGTGMLYDYILNNNITNIEYNGLDINNILIKQAKSKYLNSNFFTLDILYEPYKLEEYDYIICNGVFTEKLSLTYEEMFNFFSNSIKILFEKTKKGISFNLMSGHVDYERDDLFHVKHDILVEFLVKNLTRNYIIRNDYGLYEYTVYIYK
jgi:SAM-dependent methyltransferase